MILHDLYFLIHENLKSLHLNSIYSFMLNSLQFLAKKKKQKSLHLLLAFIYNKTSTITIIFTAINVTVSVDAPAKIPWHKAWTSSLGFYKYFIPKLKHQRSWDCSKDWMQVVIQNLACTKWNSILDFVEASHLIYESFSFAFLFYGNLIPVLDPDLLLHFASNDHFNNTTAPV